MSSDITGGSLTPYLTDYKTAKAAKEAFKSGKDFVINNISSQWDGKPCSIRDCNVGDVVTIRFNRKAKLTMYKV